MSHDFFGDVPLFREINRIIATGEEPVNYEIARQVGASIAAQGSSEPPVPREEARRFSEAVGACEVVLASYTGLPLEEPMRTEVVGRAWWVQWSLKEWRWLLDRLADRFLGQLRRTVGEPKAAPNAPPGTRQMAPILLGIQAGGLIGQLAIEALGRYDFPVATTEEAAKPGSERGFPGPFLVGRNAVEVGRAYDFDEVLFVRWLALRDASRHLVVTAVPWVASYHRGLLEEVVDALELDFSDLQRRLDNWDWKDIEERQGGLVGTELVPIVETERHRRALSRLGAFLTLFQGYAGHAADAIAPRLLGDVGRIEEGMARRRAEPSPGEIMLRSVVGVYVDRALEHSGKTFCAAVLKLEGRAALNRIWDAPDNLATAEEIKDPFAWMERVL